MNIICEGVVRKVLGARVVQYEYLIPGTIIPAGRLHSGTIDLPICFQSCARPVGNRAVTYVGFMRNRIITVFDVTCKRDVYTFTGSDALGDSTLV